jgi:formylglycine-generating enzyme required for sulfatase activity
MVPDIAWVDVPGGEFIYGEGKERETRWLDSFWMAKYPVTNAQYQCFIDDDGYGDERWWRDLERPEPTASQWSQANRPRTDVDWYEAVAFCRWLSARLGLAADAIRLPTEWEWEKAARGNDGRAYPWGDEFQSGYANLDETDAKDGPWYLEQTTAVGVYPHGGSPQGIEDLSGTVWEWCLNPYDRPDVVSVDQNDAWRVLRGGSWFYDSDYGRAAFRHRNLPGDRSDLIGFRLLRSVPLSPVR